MQQINNNTPNLEAAFVHIFRRIWTYPNNKKQEINRGHPHQWTPR